MSIFASLPAPDDEDHEYGCAWYVESSPGILTYSGKPCSCGLPNAPIIYAGSHVLPSDASPRGGRVDLACIPSHITRDGQDDRPESAGPWPYLRFGVNAEDGTVILTERHVRRIHRTLSKWLAALNTAKRIAKGGAR